ncbi:MAG: hypothetical protein F6J93_06695 [Oscillatoria sp. SIO1A7]|nr:hypothetical protein [Oscillatoria sp. SIO1A7]
MLLQVSGAKHSNTIIFAKRAKAVEGMLSPLHSPTLSNIKCKKPTLVSDRPDRPDRPPTPPDPPRPTDRRGH